jgi:DMSO reductase anchor subunit
MVYHVTQRPWWQGSRSLLRFLLTGLLAGAAVAWTVQSGTATLTSLVVASVVKLTAESHWHRNAAASEMPLLANGALIHNTTLGIPFRMRVTLLLTGGLFLPLLSILIGGPSQIYSIACATLLLSGEFLERFLFFRAALPWHMPGWSARHHS